MFILSDMLHIILHSTEKKIAFSSNFFFQFDGGENFSCGLLRSFLFDTIWAKRKKKSEKNNLKKGHTR